MNYVIFLDDERFPIKNWFSDQCVMIARSYEEAIKIIQEMSDDSKLVYVSFDHDLATEKTGYDFAKWLADADSGYVEGQQSGFMSDIFDFYVHSQNPIGAENIRCYMGNYLKHRG